MRVTLPFNMPSIAAITVWPFIFISKEQVSDLDNLRVILKHEDIHLAQQRRWAIYGLGIGLIVWFFLYELCLPIWYNPWRRKWETEAYSKGNNLDNGSIDIILQGEPYFLKSSKK